MLLSLALLLAGLLMLFRWLPRRLPLFENQPLTQIGGFVGGFASMEEGSVLYVEHPRSGQMLQFIKRADTGSAAQEVVFAYPEVEWSRERFQEVVEGARRASIAFDVRDYPARENRPAFRALEVYLFGTPERLETEAQRLVDCLIPALGLGEEDPRFLVHAQGRASEAIQGYIQEGELRRQASDDSNPDAQQRARRHLEQLRRSRGQA